MANPKNRLDYLGEASEIELIEELRRRRVAALQDCSDQEIETELSGRPGVDRDLPPRLVEK